MSKTKIIIDTDVMSDDWMAIMYLLSMLDSIEIIGISVAGTGGSYLKAAARNVLSLLKLAGKDTTTPVVLGSKSPLIYTNAFPDTIRAARTQFDGLITVPISDAPLYVGTVYDFYNELLAKESEQVAVLSIGGGTNLGGWFIHSCESVELRKKISEVVIMGGALNVPGNISDLTLEYYVNNKVAEWNVFVDVKGMQSIFESGVKTVLVPLDACYEALLPLSILDVLKVRAKSLISRYFATIMSHYGRQKDTFNAIFDLLAAVVLVNIHAGTLDKLCSTKLQRLYIEQETVLDGEPDMAGKVVSSNEHGSEVMVCCNVNAKELTTQIIDAFTTTMFL